MTSKKDKIKVFSSQYSNFFGNNQIHFPYSIATLAAYSMKDPLITDSFLFEKVFLFRKSINDDVVKAQDANILLCSCYCWNWEITKTLAKNVKEQNKDCLIIFGGPEVPRLDCETFFKEHDYVDIVVHGEGELVLHNILKEYLNGIDLKNLNIAGTQTKHRRSLPQERIKDLDIIPSPYSTDLVWDLVEKIPEINYIVSWETNRGCPFSCTFCDWGSATMSKIRKFPMERVLKEIEWFGKNNIIYIDCCDGNFGAFKKRDYEISEKLAETKGKTGYPERLNLTWVKTSSERIIPMAKILSEAGMLRAVSLSVQSLDEDTLKAVKRANIKFDKFENLVKVFENEDIQSYTELIMGLPEETVESFKNNWEILAAIYPQPTIMSWNCSVFVNAPMNHPQYRKTYGIEVFKSPMFMQHSSNEEKEIQEYEKMIRHTNSLPNGKINEVYLFNWVMMVFNSFGILYYISRFYNKMYDISYKQFYELLITYCENSSSLFSKEYEKTTAHALNGYSGGGWDHYNDEIGNISWPIEEASWLCMVQDKAKLEEEVRKFLHFFNLAIDCKMGPARVDDLIRFQLFSLNFPEDRLKDKITGTFERDWCTYFSTSKDVPLQNKKISLYKEPKVKNHDIIKWGYESIWFGRRSCMYKTKIKEMGMVSSYEI